MILYLGKCTFLIFNSPTRHKQLQNFWLNYGGRSRGYRDKATLLISYLICTTQQYCKIHFSFPVWWFYSSSQFSQQYTFSAAETTQSIFIQMFVWKILLPPLKILHKHHDYHLASVTELGHTISQAASPICSIPAHYKFSSWHPWAISRANKNGSNWGAAEKFLGL